MECSNAIPSEIYELETTGMLSYMEAMCITFGFALFGILLAKVFNLIRKHIYHDKDNLDTDFDAGGSVSLGLTATTIVSQWTWAATLLQSSAVAVKYGISGPFWYAAGASVQILLFSALSVQLKIKAPGAKTFLQLIFARFGSRIHLIFCVVALMTNIVVITMLMLGGTAVLTNLVDGFSIEMACIILTSTIGCYTFIGGLGATFYMSYFNTGIIFIGMMVLMSKVYGDTSVDNPLGSISRVYDLVTCYNSTNLTPGDSYFSFKSSKSLSFGIVNIVGNFGTVFIDQSYWQSSVAAKPKEGMWGFISGGLVWFAVPFMFATTIGFAFLSMSSLYGYQLITDSQIEEGLVAPVTARIMLGKSGDILMFVIMLMAVTSTGSAECIAVTSILVYDMYQIHWKPFRHVTDSNGCILCGKCRGRMAMLNDKCKCRSRSQCKLCDLDDRNRRESNRPIKPQYKCATHGSYRTYLEMLRDKRDWCIVIVAFAFIPITLGFNAIEVKLGWLYSFTGIMISSSVVPICLCVNWTRLTGFAMAFAAICGQLLAVFVWLVVSGLEPGGLGNGNFFLNTGKEVNMLIGNVVSIVSGALLTVAISLKTNPKVTDTASKEIWEKTRDIDNPLNPWTELYTKEFNISDQALTYDRPSLQDMRHEFRGTQKISLILSISFTLIFIILWPTVMTVIGEMSKDGFSCWVYLSETWTVIAAMFIIVVPLVTEIRDVRRQYMLVKRVGPGNPAPSYSISAQVAERNETSTLNDKC